MNDSAPAVAWERDLPIIPCIIVETPKAAFSWIKVQCMVVDISENVSELHCKAYLLKE